MKFQERKDISEKNSIFGDKNSRFCFSHLIPPIPFRWPVRFPGLGQNFEYNPLFNISEKKPAEGIENV